MLDYDIFIKGLECCRGSVFQIWASPGLQLLPLLNTAAELRAGQNIAAQSAALQKYTAQHCYTAEKILPNTAVLLN